MTQSTPINTASKKTECILVELNENRGNLSDAVIKKFGKKRFVPISDLVNFDLEEVLFTLL